MKIKALPKKFNLNKRTIVDLTRFEQSRVMAGDADTSCWPPECYFSGSAVLRLSTLYYMNSQTQPLPADRRYWPCYMQPPTNTISPD